MIGRENILRKVKTSFKMNVDFADELIDSLGSFYLITAPQNLETRTIFTKKFVSNNLKKILTSHQVLTSHEFLLLKKDINKYLEKKLNNKNLIEIFNAYHIHKNTNEFKIDEDKLLPEKLENLIDLFTCDMDKLTIETIKQNAKLYFEKTQQKSAKATRKNNIDNLLTYATLMFAIFYLLKRMTNFIVEDSTRKGKAIIPDPITSNIYMIGSSAILSIMIAILNLTNKEKTSAEFLKVLGYQKNYSKLISSIFNPDKISALIKDDREERNAKKSSGTNTHTHIYKQPETANIKPFSHTTEKKEVQNITTIQNQESRLNESTKKTGITVVSYAFFSQRKSQNNNFDSTHGIQWFDILKNSPITLPSDLIETELTGDVANATLYIVYDPSETDREKVSNFRKIADEAIFYTASQGQRCVHYLHNSIWALKDNMINDRILGTEIAQSADGKKKLIYVISQVTHQDMKQKMQNPEQFKRELTLKALNALEKKSLSRLTG